MNSEKNNEKIHEKKKTDETKKYIDMFQKHSRKFHLESRRKCVRERTSTRCVWVQRLLPAAYRAENQCYFFVVQTVICFPFDKTNEKATQKKRNKTHMRQATSYTVDLEKLFRKVRYHGYVERVTFSFVGVLFFFLLLPFLDCHINCCCIDMLQPKLQISPTRKIA